jgi:tripartite ATP-independent transporter DctP family solute receptor
MLTARLRLALGLWLGLQACIPAPALAQSVKLTLGHGAAPSNPRHEAALKFAEVVKAKTQGRVEVRVAHSAQLGDDVAMLAALRAGTLDMSVNSQGPMAALVPEYAAYGLPFLFNNSARAFKLLDGQLGKELAEKTAAKGLIVLGYWDNGIRHMTNNKHPITHPSDLHDLRMRVPPDGELNDFMQALGAEPRQMRFADVYAALKQGTVDGQENPIANIHASKFYEVQKYLSLTGHQFQMCPLLIGRAAWERLPEADRRAVQEAAAEATAFQRRRFQEAEAQNLQDLKARGMQISTVDKVLFQKATVGVAGKWMFGPINAYAIRVVGAAR